MEQWQKFCSSIPDADVGHQLAGVAGQQHNVPQRVS
jgi:hypothetical protein